MKKLFKDRWNRKLGGVCGGLAVYFGIDATIIRLLFAIIALFTLFLPVLAIYIILWLLLPEGPKAYIEPQGRKLYRSKKDRKLAGVCGGLGTFFKIDANILRILFVVATLFSFGAVPIVYVICIFIIPETPGISPKKY